MTQDTGREDSMIVIERDKDGVPTIWCDPEIAGLVTALNNGGMRTVASCSGHGYLPPTVILADGSVLVLLPNVDEMNRVIKACYDKDINGGPIVRAVLEAKQVEPECLTCNDHGAVGNAINGDLCPDCTLPRMAREAKQAEVQMPRPIGVLHVFEPHEGSGVVCAEASTNADHLPHGWHNLYTEQQVRAMLCCTAPARKPLTELEIDAAVYGLGHGQPTYRQVARAIERAHGITGGKDGQQT